MGGDSFVLEPTKEQYKAIVGGKDNQMELVKKLVSQLMAPHQSAARSFARTHGCIYTYSRLSTNTHIHTCHT